MSLLIVEGPRKSGKTYLVQNQDVYPVFKFPFNEVFSKWNPGRESKDTHWMGLGKEIMLHELYNQSQLKEETLIVDRGILTNSVWGVFQKRIPLEQAIADLIKFSETGLLDNVVFLIIEGTWNESREKDIWDGDDVRIEEERRLFTQFSSLLQDLGHKVIVYPNHFDDESLKRFILTLKNI